MKKEKIINKPLEHNSKKILAITSISYDEVITLSGSNGDSPLNLFCSASDKNNLNIVSLDDGKAIREWKINLSSGDATLIPMFDPTLNGYVNYDKNCKIYFSYLYIF